NIASTDANIASSKQIKIGKRTKPEILFKAIAEVCSEYVTLEEIATKTGRSTGYLKDRIIPEMLRLHIIERLFPEAPTNPHQKYRRI
ncbi:MAG: AAA family ATPase, partial [Prevotella nigrescens]